MFSLMFVTLLEYNKYRWVIEDDTMVIITKGALVAMKGKRVGT